MSKYIPQIDTLTLSSHKYRVVFRILLISFIYFTERTEYHT